MWGKKSAPEQEATPVPIQIPVPVSAQILEEEVVEEPPSRLYPPLPTPVKFEDINKESKNVIGTLELFDGFRFEFNKTISEHPPFGLSHAIGMGSVLEPANYNLGTNLIYRGSSFSGRVDTDGQVMGRFQQEITSRATLRVSGQASSEPHNSAAHVELDYKGGNWFGTFKWGNPGIYGLSYMQSVTPRLSIGLDTFYHHKQAMSLLTGGFRFETDNSVSALILTTGHLSTSYTHRVNNRVNLSTELTVGWPTGAAETSLSMGLDYMLRTSHIKAHVDTNWKVSCYLEEMLNQFTRFMISAELDHKKKSYRFGFGVLMAL